VPQKAIKLIVRRETLFPKDMTFNFERYEGRILRKLQNYMVYNEK